MDNRKEMLERFGIYANFIGITKNAIGLTIGRDRDYVRKFSGKPSVQTRELFRKVFPALNLDWIITGEGEMILQEQKDKAKKICPLTTVEQQLLKENKRLQEKIKELEKQLGQTKMPLVITTKSTK